jgi:hypothetical protein
MDNQLSVIVKDSGLDQTKSEYILERFQDYFKIAAEWEIKAKAIKITNDSQKTDMEIARIGRLFLREKRIAIEKSRKDLKEQSIREGKAIDGIANILKSLIIPIEDYLDQQENFTKYRLQAEERERLIAEQQRIEKENIERENKRIAEEKAEKERIQAENERLKQEAIEKEKLLEIERKKQAEELAKIQAENDAKIKEKERLVEIERKKQEEILKQEQEKARIEAEKLAEINRQESLKQAELFKQERIKAENERLAKEKLEEENKKRIEEEDRIKRQKEEEERKIKSAPDRIKIMSFINSVQSLIYPEIQSKEIKICLDEFKKQIENLVFKLSADSKIIRGYYHEY